MTCRFHRVGCSLHLPENIDLCPDGSFCLCSDQPGIFEVAAQGDQLFPLQLAFDRRKVNVLGEFAQIHLGNDAGETVLANHLLVFLDDQQTGDRFEFFKQKSQRFGFALDIQREDPDVSSDFDAKRVAFLGDSLLKKGILVGLDLLDLTVYNSDLLLVFDPISTQL